MHKGEEVHDYRLKKVVQALNLSPSDTRREWKLLHHQVLLSVIQIISVRRSSMQITARNQPRSREPSTGMQIE